MTRSKKRLIWLFIALLLISGGAFYYYKTSAEKAEKIQTAVAERGLIEDSITAQGTLEPKDYVDVGVQVSGQIQKLYVDIGDVVKEGQLLAELDPRSYESMVAANEAQIKSLDAQIKQQSAQADYDQMQFDRAQKLIKSNATSQEALEEKEKALKISKATIESLQAQKEQAQADLESNVIKLGYTKIYSPMNGIVSDRLANEGQTLNANQTTPTILQVANMDVMTIRAEIAEADVMRLKTGMESTFSTLGMQSGKWKGVIRQILPTPEVVNDVVLYSALIDAENKDGRLMNGMSTQNQFIVARAENVILIPTRALGMRLEEKDNDKGQAYQVHVLKKDKQESRTIYTGLMTREKVEVKHGLSEGETVITSGAKEESKVPKSTGPRMPGASL